MLLFEKRCCHFFSVVLDGIFFILTRNDDIHKSLDEFEIWPEPTTELAALDVSIFSRFGSQVSIVALWATCYCMESFNLNNRYC